MTPAQIVVEPEQCSVVTKRRKGVMKFAIQLPSKRLIVSVGDTGFTSSFNRRRTTIFRSKDEAIAFTQRVGIFVYKIIRF